MIWTSFFKLEPKKHFAFDDFGQFAATRLRITTGSILFEYQQAVIFFACFQLLVAMAVYPSNWV